MSLPARMGSQSADSCILFWKPERIGRLISHNLSLPPAFAATAATQPLALLQKSIPANGVYFATKFFSFMIRAVRIYSGWAAFACAAAMRNFSAAEHLQEVLEQLLALHELVQKREADFLWRLARERWQDAHLLCPPETIGAVFSFCLCIPHVLVYLAILKRDQRAIRFA